MGLDLGGEVKGFELDFGGGENGDGETCYGFCGT